MENPRHMTQIGLPRGNRRIFLEDYVVSYMKQNKSETAVKVALFGHTKKAEDTVKFFVFGAAVILADNYSEECERIRKYYFSEYQYLGYGELSNDLPDGFYVETEQEVSYIEGYYCFYDDNDAMLSYMVEERERGKEKTGVDKKSADSHFVVSADVQRDFQKELEVRATERISAREYRRLASQKEPQPINKLKLSVVITFLIMCAITVRDYLSEPNSEEKNYSTQVVTESNLVDALQQENGNEAEEQVSDINIMEMTDVSDASEEVIEREPVVFEQEVEPETVETMSAVSVPVTEEPEEIYHIVKQGDTLTTISILYYGNKEQVNAICRANDISQPDDIKIGQKLWMP